MSSPEKVEPQRAILESFANPNPQRDYEIDMHCPEFTCLCPKTGQPDFADFRITYVADEKCIELKSLKIYMWSFRDRGAFHEAVTNQIMDDLIAVCDPRYMQVQGAFYVRGGITTTITVEHHKERSTEA